MAMSHPTWVRGLKFEDPTLSYFGDRVAPHVGAWIEIMIQFLYQHTLMGRTPRGCVD